MTIERVVVTGASSGIGAACVEAYRALNAEVLGVDVVPTSNADDHLQLDLGRTDCGEKVFRFCGNRSIDVLVNNAAVGLDKEAVETSADDFDRVMAVNLRAPFLVSSALRPTLAERRGAIVNVASVHAVATSIMVSAYAASKGGLVAVTRALALEWAPEIRVNAVLPGAVDTAMLRDGLLRTESSLADLVGRHPAQRVGRPEQVAEAVVFLARGEFTTGTTLTIDGGATAKLSTE